MKYFTLITFLFMTYHESFSQTYFPIDSVSKQISFKGVIIVDSTSKHVLFIRGNRWFAGEFRSSKNVIQFSDSVAGIIIGKGSIDVNWHVLGGVRPMGYVNFSFELAIKDNKYKYTINDFWHDGSSINSNSPGDLRIEKTGMSFNRGAWDEIKEETYQKINSMISSLKKGMFDSTLEKSDW